MVKTCVVTKFNIYSQLKHIRRASFYLRYDFYDFHLSSLFSMGNCIVIIASTTMFYTSSFSSEYLVTELLIIFYIGVI